MKIKVNPAWKMSLALLTAGVVVAVSGQLRAGQIKQPKTTTASDRSGPGPGPFESQGPGCNIFPPSAAVGSGVDPSYFGPPPSESNPSLVGPVQLVRSGPVSFQDGTITLPLYRGKLAKGNKTVWYILTDTSDATAASALGLNFSQKLQFAAVGHAPATSIHPGNWSSTAALWTFNPNATWWQGQTSPSHPPISRQARSETRITARWSRS